MEVIVHERVMGRHPELSEADVVHAWEHAFAMQRRIKVDPESILAAGADRKRRVLELLGVEISTGRVLVYHAMPITMKVARELGL